MCLVQKVILQGPVSNSFNNHKWGKHDCRGRCDAWLLRYNVVYIAVSLGTIPDQGGGGGGGGGGGHQRSGVGALTQLTRRTVKCRQQGWLSRHHPELPGPGE